MNLIFGLLIWIGLGLWGGKLLVDKGKPKNDEVTLENIGAVLIAILFGGFTFAVGLVTWCTDNSNKVIFKKSNIKKFIKELKLRRTRCSCGKIMEVVTEESVKHSPLLVKRSLKCGCGKEIVLEIKPA